MNSGDFFLFYIALGIIFLALVLLALPTLIHGPKKNSDRMQK